MTWYNTTLGQFDNAEQWIGLDFRNLFSSPIRADVTFFHEVTHSLLSRTTDMGQAMQNICFFMPRFTHLDKGQLERVNKALMSAQQFPQEGFATYMEMLRLRQRTSWEQALGAKAAMPPDYRDRFERMEFMFGQPRRLRDHFTRKVSTLVMENGFRKSAPALDLLRAPEALEAYFADADNNPAERLAKVLAGLKKNPHIVKEKPRKMARLLGVKYFEPATKTEVAAFVNYILGLAGLDQSYTTDMVGKTVDKNALAESADNILVSNMNLNLKEGGIWAWETEAIEFEAAHAEAAFVVHHSLDKVAEQDFLEQNLGRKFEVDLILFDKDGQKYVAFTSLDHINALMQNQLKSATVLTKWGICNPVDSSFSISALRKPDVIIYNRPADMLRAFELNDSKIKKYEYIHLGSMEDHPFQMLLVKINGVDTVHYVNGFGSAGISTVVAFIKNKGRAMAAKELELHARAVNDTLATMGMPWEIDWVATMLKKTELVRRQAS